MDGVFSLGSDVASLQSHNPGTKKKVLIIEDVGEMRFMLKTLMTSLGYTNIDVESSGHVALKLILNNVYDIILCDYNLGGTVNGQQILEAARKNYSQDHSTIFMMITADTKYENVVRVLEYQPDTYLAKPFPPAAFYRRLKKVENQKKVFEGINTARKQLNYTAMERNAKVIMERHPHLALQCHKVIGESLFAQKRYEEARTHYQTVAIKNKNLAWVFFGIGLCELKLNNLAEAIESFDHTTQLSRHFLSAYDKLADCHLLNGSTQEAQASLLSALEVSPRSFERAHRLAELSVNIKDWSNAERAYSRLIRLTRETAHEKVEFYYRYLECLDHILRNRGKCPVLMDKFKKALSRLRTFGKSNPASISNSYRIEVKRLLSDGNSLEASKTWDRWKHMIKIGKATALTVGQEKTLEKHLRVSIQK